MSAQATSRSDSLLGRQVCGEYVIEELLRSGPLATAYSAVGSDDGERYVVRVLHRARGGTPGAFRTEMDRMQAIQHRAITPVVAYSVAPWGVTVVSRAVGECTLRQRLDEGALSHAETGWLICEVAAALDALHSAHPPIVHQALCPQNIVLGPEGSPVWVEECGLAQALAAAGWLTGPVDGYGEQGYLSPDDLAGQRDPGADIFVLASIAYECLTGVRAFSPTEASQPGAFTRSPPGVRLTQPLVAVEVDAALTRAWRFNDPVGFDSASAFAMEFARGLMSESGRVTPLISLPPAKPSRSGMRPLPENDVSDAEGQAIDAAFDDLWNGRHTKEYVPQPPTSPRPDSVPPSSLFPGAASLPPTVVPDAVVEELAALPVPVAAPQLPPAPTSPVASPVPPHRSSLPPPVPPPTRHTPTLRWSTLPPSLGDETPLPIETIEPEHAVRIPLREALTAPSLARRTPQPPPEEEPATIAPPSKYSAWANQVSRPGSPVAPPPTDDEGMRNTPVLIPPAPAMPTTVAPASAITYERPVMEPLAPAPVPRTISRRPSARPVARVTALPIISTRGSFIMGGSIVVAALILAGSHVYVSRMAAHDRRHEATLSAQPGTHAELAAAPSQPAVAVAASSPASPPTVPTPPAPAPTSVEVLPDHPNDHDVAAVQEHLVPLVASCALDPHPTRRVRVRVTYVGATGQPVESTTRGHYAHTLASACIAAAAREVPVPRFSADRWTWDYAFAAPQGGAGTSPDSPVGISESGR